MSSQQVKTVQSIKETFVASLTGRRFTNLNDDNVFSGSNSTQFSHYIFKRQIFIRKQVPGNTTHNQVFCTHCYHSAWKARIGCPPTTTYRCHLDSTHPHIPHSQEEEDLRVSEKITSTPPSASANGAIAVTPFSIAASSTSRSAPLKFNNEKYQEHLAAFVVTSNQPLAVTNHPNFRRMISYCQPAVVHISRRQLGREIHKLYESTKGMVKDRLLGHTANGGKCHEH